MKLIMPSYCSSFLCSAEKCSDNCCIGWEIDIDEKTAEFYSGVKGKFGERLSESIAHDECSSFILDGERCPFLNENNLCDIIINLGEEHLCQICNDHPRYFEWYGEIKEGGIGLCCEEAARIILTAENPTDFSSSEITFEQGDEFDEGLFCLLKEARNIIFSILSDSGHSIKERVARVLFFSERLQVNIDNYNDILPEDYEGATDVSGDMLSVLKSLTLTEPIDEKWTEYLYGIISTYEERKFREDITLYQRNLLIYYIYRYFLKGVFDGEILSRVKLACVSTAVISYFISDDCEIFGDIVDVCKLFSKQLEYSEENMELMREMFYEKDFFETEKIIGLF